MLKLKLPFKFTKQRAARSETSITSDHSPSDNDIQIDKSSSSVECELLKIYDACQSLPADRRKSSFSKKDICCSERISAVPPSPPSKWPQCPILLRPSPDSGMKILGVRYSSSKEYVPMLVTGYCEGCTLPINNGHEAPGKCMVIDFETELFIGTLLLRVKNISTASASSDNNSVEPDNEDYYFHKKKRTFQATVRGRFKQQGIQMSECITGQMFNRPAGYLPPRLIVKGAVSIISRLAPQLQARLEGDCPRFLSPLVSTAQTVLVNDCSEDNTTTNLSVFSGADERIEENLYEPQASEQYSIMQSIITSGAGDLISISSTSSENASLTSRIKTRKKAFDKIFSEHTKIPIFDTNKEYTFEFFQHLITFDDFSLDFVKPIGKHSMHVMLNGQPLKFMAAHQTRAGQVSEGEELRWLWCFDLWHESLYDDALLALEGDQDEIS